MESRTCTPREGGPHLNQGPHIPSEAAPEPPGRGAAPVPQG